MISKTLQTLDGQLKISIPSVISEITLGMLIAMQEDNSDIETISILSGISKDELYNVRNINDFDIFKEHVLSLVHQISYECNNLPLPKQIFICGKKVEVTKDLNIEPAGAFMECRDLIADEINEHIKVFGEDDYKEHFKPSLKITSFILAHYLYCPTTGLNYNADKAEAFQKEILKLSIALTIPIAKHFFLNYPFAPKTKRKFFPAVIQTWKRKLALRNSKGSRFLILLILWPLGI